MSDKQKTSEERFQEWCLNNNSTFNGTREFADAVWSEQESHYQQTVSELQAEVERLKEDKEDILGMYERLWVDYSVKIKALSTATDYVDELAECAESVLLSNGSAMSMSTLTDVLHKYAPRTSQKLWCAACGSWGDHRSGTCPEIKKEEKEWGE